MDDRRPFRYLVSQGELREHATITDSGVESDYALVYATGTDVGHIRGTPRQDPFVGGLNMGMRAENDRCLTINMVRQRFLLSRGLRVKVHDNVIYAVSKTFRDLAKPSKRTVDHRHPFPSLQIDHGNATLFSFDDHDAAPGDARGIIVRPQDVGTLLEQLLDLLIMPDVIPRGYYVYSRTEQLIRQVRGYTEPIVRVLAVGYDEIRPVAPDESLEGTHHRAHAGLADYISQYQDLHDQRAYSTMRVSRIIVTFILPGYRS